MAARTIDKTKMLARPPFTITFEDGSAAELLSVYVANGDNLSLNMELKTVDTDLGDASELSDIVGLRGMVTYNLEELDQTDIDSLNDSAEVVKVATNKGGANGTGKTITFDTLDHVRALPADGWGTQVEIKKVVTGSDLTTLLGSMYTLEDNA